MNDSVPFAGLGPDVILSAVERFGMECDGHFLALNSYENRVYQIGVQDRPPVVGKFYRPGRWSDEAILEEHAFAAELAAHEIPVAAPLVDGAERTLVHHQGFRVALFPRLAGGWPELDQPGRLAWVGRFLGRIHAVARAGAFAHRPRRDRADASREARGFLLDSGLVSVDCEGPYRDVTGELLDLAEARLDASAHAPLRLHGDCHPGNVLWGEDGPAFVDLDDCATGPAVQDLWMLVSGDAGERESQLDALLRGYELFSTFDQRELRLVEALRALRMVHYAAWLARRWDDPAFPAAFPWFGTSGYWRGHVDDLRAQVAVLAA